MPLAINRITCAVTGSGVTQDKSLHVPRSLKHIATSIINGSSVGVLARRVQV